MAYGVLQKFLSKSIGKWSGELLVDLEQFPIDFKKLAWRAPGQFTYGILKESLFKIKSKWVWNAPGQFAYGILKKFLSKSIRNWSGKLLFDLRHFLIDFKNSAWRASG